jgi:hypothetical protein
METVVPGLHKLGGYVRTREKPGLIVVSDGVRDPSEFPMDYADYVLLRRITAHRLRVSFEQRRAGTHITIRGGATPEVRQAINRLGEPGHWPSAR